MIDTSVLPLSAVRETALPLVSSARICVRITHDTPLIASGIRAVLTRSCEFQLIPEMSVGDPDVLIADVATGLRALTHQDTHRRVLIVALDDGEVIIRKALAHGAQGFLLHTCAAEELTAAVKTVATGGTAFAPRVANRVVQSIASETLTERELEVLQLLVQGSTDKDVARRLRIALGTVKSHVRSILNKLGATRRTEAAAIAQRRGLACLEATWAY